MKVCIINIILIVPASIQVINARWRLFGHILSLNGKSPAKQAMVSYFDDKKVYKVDLVISVLLLLSYLTSIKLC